jgi:hypothetical protein
MRRRRSLPWPTVRAALVFAVVFAIVLAIWLPDAPRRSLMQRLDILLLLAFLGVVIAFTVEADPSASGGERRDRRGWRLRIGGLAVRRRK